MNIAHYAKSLLYVGAAALAFLVTASSDDKFTGAEGVNLSVIIVGAGVIYVIPNLPQKFAQYAKTGAAALIALGTTALSFWDGGISTTEWFQIGIAILGSIGVYIVPNESKVPVVATVELGAASVQRLQENANATVVIDGKDISKS